MATVENVLLGDFDMTKASKPVQYATASALAKHLETYRLDASEAANVARFMHEVNSVPRMLLWASLCHTRENLFIVHHHVEELMIDTAELQDDELKTYMHYPRDKNRDECLRELGYLV